MRMPEPREVRRQDSSLLRSPDNGDTAGESLTELSTNIKPCVLGLKRQLKSLGRFAGNLARIVSAERVVGRHKLGALGNMEKKFQERRECPLHKCYI